MRHLLALPLVFLLTSAVAAVASAQDTALHLSQVKRLIVYNTNGTVLVRATSQEPWLRSKITGQVSVTTRRADQILYIDAKPVERSCSTCRADLELRVPPGLEVVVEVGNGTVRLDGAAARGQLKVGNGTAEVSGAQNAQLQVAVGNGNVSVLRSRLTVNATVGNGNITVEDVVFTPESSNQLQTRVGTVRLTGVRAPSGLRLEGATELGSVSVTLPGYVVTATPTTFLADRSGAARAWVKATSSIGDVLVSQ